MTCTKSLEFEKVVSEVKYELDECAEGLASQPDRSFIPKPVNLVAIRYDMRASPGHARPREPTLVCTM